MKGLLHQPLLKCRANRILPTCWGRSYASPPAADSPELMVLTRRRSRAAEVKANIPRVAEGRSFEAIEKALALPQLKSAGTRNVSVVHGTRVSSPTRKSPARSTPMARIEVKTSEV